MRKVRDLSGKTFHRLIVLSDAGIIKNHHFWNCLCSCGAIKRIDYFKLVSGSTKSCGCLRAEITSIRMKKYDHSIIAGTKTKEYATWSRIKLRCYNKQNPRYKDYGARNIKMCQRWLYSFENFFIDMGFAPSPDHSIDRINNNGDYEKSNCRWATNMEQANNRRSNILITYNGITKNLKQWSNEIGFNYTNVNKRLKRGWSIEDAFYKPIMH